MAFLHCRGKFSNGENCYWEQDDIPEIFFIKGIEGIAKKFNVSDCGDENGSIVFYHFKRNHDAVRFRRYLLDLFKKFRVYNVEYNNENDWYVPVRW